MESFPANLDVLAEVEVEYETFPGWMQPTTGAKTFQDLPENARKYIEFIESFIKVPIKYIVSLLISTSAVKYLRKNRELALAGRV